MQRNPTLVDVARKRLEEAPADTTFRFLVDGESEEERLSREGLVVAATRVAASLQAEGEIGERAVLLFPPGLGYVTALFGAMFAGWIAVPAYPPEPHRANEAMRRLRGILRDARPRVVLCPAFVRDLLSPRIGGEFPATKWLAIDELGSSGSAWRAPAIGHDFPALLQYTSGSTGEPRGVVLTHANLLANCEASARRFEVTSSSVGVFWLPPYHDMGLIAGLLMPVFVGGRVVLMSPLAFLERPVRWLRAMSRHSAGVSGGPTFAFDLCTRRIGELELDGLDLSSWEVAFCGAEPLRGEVFDAFAQKFGRVGFRSAAIYPCYGMAEATLFVSGGAKLAGAKYLMADPVALEARRVELDQEGVRLVGCGRVADGHELRVVDPLTREDRGDDQIGEIWVRGPSIGLEYWNRRSESESAFGAELAKQPGAKFLRSGDLGFTHDGELYVSGRLKDLIIVAGRNLYPQDIEATVSVAHPSVRRGCCAAFSVDAADGEALVVAAEVRDAAAEDEASAVRSAIHRCVAQEHGVVAADVFLVAKGEIPKTTSGKIRRAATRAEYLRRNGEARARVLERSLHRIDWIVDLAPTSRSYDQAREWLLIRDQRGVSDALQARLVASGERCRSVDCSDGSLAAAQFSKSLHVVYCAALDLEDEDLYAQAGWARSVDLAMTRLVGAIDGLNETGGSPRLSVLTQGARSVHRGEVARVGQAGAWGVVSARSGGASLRIRAIDLDPNADLRDASLDALYRELRTLDDEEQVALRGTRRFIARLRSGLNATATRRRQALISPERRGTYWLGGSFRGSGLDLAEHVARSGCRRLLIAPFDLATREVEQALRSACPGLEIVALDCRHPWQLGETLARCHDLDAPLRGAIQIGALSSDGEPSTPLTDELSRVWELQRATSQLDLDFFALGSAHALPGFAGSPEQSARDAWFEAIARARHAKGARACSMGWNPGGTPADASARPLQPDLAFDVLQSIIESGEPRGLVVLRDGEGRIALPPSAKGGRFFDEVR